METATIDPDAHMKTSDDWRLKLNVMHENKKETQHTQ